MFDPFGKPIKGLILHLMLVSAGLSCMTATIMPLAPRKGRSGVGYGATDCFGQLGEVRDGPLF
jgi:hypothetical protein